MKMQLVVETIVQDGRSIGEVAHTNEDLTATEVDQWRLAAVRFPNGLAIGDSGLFDAWEEEGRPNKPFIIE